MDPIDIESETAVSVEAFQFDPCATPAARELVYYPYLGFPHSKEAGLAALERLKGKLRGYDAILSKQSYLAGDKLTLVDLFHVQHTTALVEVAKTDCFTSDETPNVKRWWHELSNLPCLLTLKNSFAETYTSQ